MARTARDIMQMIRDEEIQMVDFKIVDINGQFRHVTIPAAHFNEETMSTASASTPPTTATPWWKRAIWSTSPTWIPP